MTRTPLLGSLLRALNLARHAERQGLPTGDALEQREVALTRRTVLRASAAAAGLALSACAQPLTPAQPLRALGGGGGGEEVAVIGAGIAGLVVAYRLTQAGVPCRVFEASDRAGGRMHTLRGHFARPVELGGELIDSGHKRLRRLAGELKLNLLDLVQTDVGVAAQWYDFGGQRYSEAQAVEAFRPLARQIDRDLASLGADTVTYRQPDAGRRLDALSVRAYLESIGASGWLLALLDVAYTIEYGLDASEQSSLNFLYLVGNRPGQFELFGYSDERYSIEGGNDQVPAILAQRLGARVQYGSRLEAVTLRSDGRYALSLNEGGTRRSVVAHRVVFALPFTTLRQVNLGGVALPAVKRRAIQELGYGTNAKLIAGFTRRVWRDTYGSSGEVYTDRPWQNTWESSRAVTAPGGCLTNYLGGAAGLRVGQGTPGAQTDRWLSDMNAVWPGLSAARSAEAPVRAFWPGNPYVLASYACYRVGQWTTLAGAEGEAAGRLHFCGEHTSLDYQGYMEGGVESAERVVGEILPATARRASLAARTA